MLPPQLVTDSPLIPTTMTSDIGSTQGVAKPDGPYDTAPGCPARYEGASQVVNTSPMQRPLNSPRPRNSATEVSCGIQIVRDLPTVFPNPRTGRTSAIALSHVTTTSGLEAITVWDR